MSIDLASLQALGISDIRNVNDDFEKDDELMKELLALQTADACSKPPLGSYYYFVYYFCLTISLHFRMQKKSAKSNIHNKNAKSITTKFFNVGYTRITSTRISYDGRSVECRSGFDKR